MARHRFFAITLMGIGMLLNSRAEAVTDARAARIMLQIASADVSTPGVGPTTTNA
jgi:hypothetical protein